jgi:hypothetical protein
MKLDSTQSIPLLQNNKLLDFLKSDIDPWINTPFKGYVNINNKIKGKYGELFVETLMIGLGHEVKKAKTSTSGHDRVITNFLTEIKFGLSHRNGKDKSLTLTDVFSFNHFSVNKDWERAILVGINIDCNPYVVWFNKIDFVNEVSKSDAERKYFGRQQAGKNGGNDDWMFMTGPESWQSFLNEPWVKSINQW